MDYAVRVMTSAKQGRELFGHIGRFLASADVRKELGGYPINDGPDYVWLIALRKRSMTCVGFLSYEITPEKATLRYTYVEEAHRGNGVFREMRRQFLALVDSAGVVAHATVCGDRAAAALKTYGFSPVGKPRGDWIRMVREGK